MDNSNTHIRKRSSAVLDKYILNILLKVVINFTILATTHIHTRFWESLVYAHSPSSGLIRTQRGEQLEFIRRWLINNSPFLCYNPLKNGA